ncbi:hypothetical protein [Streptomyces sp. NPDC007856]|uniref:hypothetical protein n=1 Tax=Streptomyces sp. NPDC007856 TaxID=3364781 RepID=UPI00369D2935
MILAAFERHLGEPAEGWFDAGTGKPRRRGAAPLETVFGAIRYCLAHATCPVLAVPPSPLEAGLRAAHRRNALGLRLDVRRMRREFDTVPPGA